MATFVWNSSTSAAFGASPSWRLQNGPRPRAAPGLGDVAVLSNGILAGAGGTVTGSGSVAELDIGAAATPWLLAANITTQRLIATAPFTLSSVGRLTIVPAGEVPVSGTISGGAVLDGGVLDSQGVLTVGASDQYNRSLTLRNNASATLLGGVVGHGTNTTLWLESGSTIAVRQSAVLETGAGSTATEPGPSDDFILGTNDWSDPTNPKLSRAYLILHDVSSFTTETNLVVGRDALSNASVHLYDGSTSIIKNKALVGVSGQGDVLLDHGASVQTATNTDAAAFARDYDIFGQLPGSSGSLDVGFLSSWHSGNGLILGSQGAGSGYVEANGLLSVGNLLSLGERVGGAGTVTVAGSGALVQSGGRTVLGGTIAGGSPIAGGTGSIAVTGGGRFVAAGLVLFAGSSVLLDATSAVGLGPSADAGGTAAGLLTVTSLSAIDAQGGAINGSVQNDGAVSNSFGHLSISGGLTGKGLLNVGPGLLEIGGALRYAGTVTFYGVLSTLRAPTVYTTNRVITGFKAGNAIDLADVAPGSVSLGSGPDPSNWYVIGGGKVIVIAKEGQNGEVRLYGDAAGGTAILIDSPPAPGDIHITNAATNVSVTAPGVVYTGPVDYLQRQYIYAGTDPAAIAATVPNAFLKGGPGSDALLAFGGNNVLDGGGGSNFLIGGDGADGGRDTFFVDSRSGVETWSTIVNFHPGDQATIFGFHPGQSTRPYTDLDGAAGFKGLTIHSELNGPGTGILGSMTFTGIDRATANAHFSITSGTLLPGTQGAIDYLLIQYNR